jgi:hypothetical protein
LHRTFRYLASESRAEFTSECLVERFYGVREADGIVGIIGILHVKKSFTSGAEAVAEALHMRLAAAI